MVKEFLLKRKIPLMLILSGLLSSIPLIFTFLGFLQWVSFIPAAIALIWSFEEGAGLRKFYGRGLLFFWSYYIVTLHWFFYMYPLDFAGLNNAASLVVVMVACFGLSLFQALWSGLAFVLFGLGARCEAVQKHRILLPFLGAAVWVIAEWWQTVGWWGVPWGRVPLGQIDATIFVRSSAIFGSYFVTFIILAVNFFLAMTILRKDFRKIAESAALGLFCLNLALGAVVTLTYNETEGEAVKVAAAQGNISSADKWNSSSLENTLAIYERLTAQAAEQGADLVVWPETALPYVLLDSEDLTNFVTALAKENEVTIIVSAFTDNSGRGELSNSMIEIRPDGTVGKSIYSKQRLVPFGEFVPMRELVMFLIPPLANIGMLDDDLLAGEESVVLESELGWVGCGVCFDSIYETVTLGAIRNGAEIIAISTNDSWFSDSAALDMHNSQSRLRAIETGRYVVRSANTGISSIIDPLGNVKEQLGALEEGVVVSEAYMRNNRTIYSYIGNTFVILCAVFIAGLFAVQVYFKFDRKFLKKS